jgi:YD repeat-containing protein
MSRRAIVSGSAPGVTRRGRSRFTTTPTTSLDSLYEPATPAEAFAYDSLGNLKTSRTPRGFYTRFYRDGVGRDTLTYTPIDTVSARTVANLILSGMRSRTVYDVLGRAITTETIGPAMPGGGEGEQHLVVKNTYDLEDNLVRVARIAGPNPAGLNTLISRWGYDAAGRQVADTASDGNVERRSYDAAGNAVSVTCT